MDNEMIERCMKAHYNSYMKDFGEDAVLLEEQSLKVQQKLKEAIIETIKAMKEPTEKMIEAANNGDCLEEGSSAYGCWQAMIDSITND